MSRVVRISQVVENNIVYLRIKFSYDPVLIGMIKQVPGSFWYKDERSWYISDHKASREQLNRLLRELQDLTVKGIQLNSPSESAYCIEAAKLGQEFRNYLVFRQRLCGRGRRGQSPQDEFQGAGLCGYHGQLQHC